MLDVAVVEGVPPLVCAGQFGETGLAASVVRPGGDEVSAHSGGWEVVFHLCSFLALRAGLRGRVPPYPALAGLGGSVGPGMGGQRLSEETSG